MGAGRREGWPSGRDCAVDVGVVGRGLIAGDGRIVDDGGAEGGDAAADADAEQVGRAGLAGGGDPVIPLNPRQAGRGRPWRARAACPPVAASGLLVVMTSVALACLEPFFAPSRGLR